MKIFTILAFSALLLTLSTCSKKDTQCNGITGTLKVINQSANKYDIYINDLKKGTLNGGAASSWPLTEDYYEVKTIQASGIDGTPIEHSWNSAVTACSTTTVTIP